MNPEEVLGPYFWQLPEWGPAGDALVKAVITDQPQVSITDNGANVYYSDGKVSIVLTSKVKVLEWMGMS